MPRKQLATVGCLGGSSYGRVLVKEAVATVAAGTVATVALGSVLPPQVAVATVEWLASSSYCRMEPNRP